MMFYEGRESLGENNPLSFMLSELERNLNFHYQISREQFEPEPGFEPWTSRSLAWLEIWRFEVRIQVQNQIFLLKCDNVNFTMHKL